MVHLTKTTIKKLVFILTLSLFVVTVSAQEDKPEYEKAKKEITETFGSFPSFFDAFPQYALPSAWQLFKDLKGPKSSIDPKNRELIQLAVSAQIPCVYCVYFHTASAEAFGASEEEIKEAVALGAETRHWSMIIQGAQIDYEEFKKEFQEMMSYMSAQSNVQ